MRKTIFSGVMMVMSLFLLEGGADSYYTEYWERAEYFAITEKDTGPLSYSSMPDCMKVFSFSNFINFPSSSSSLFFNGVSSCLIFLSHPLSFFEPFQVYIYQMPMSLQDVPTKEIRSPLWLGKNTFKRTTSLDRSFEFRSSQQSEIEMFLYRLFVDNQWDSYEQYNRSKKCGYECEFKES